MEIAEVNESEQSKIYWSIAFFEYQDVGDDAHDLCILFASGMLMKSYS